LELNADDINVELWFHLNGLTTAYTAREYMDCVTAMFARRVI